MITKLTIKRFKSIRELAFECRKVNLFVGAPDTGKTNILEALHFVSRLGWGRPIDDALRLRHELRCDALFHRQFFDAPFEVRMTLDAPLVGTLPSEVAVETAIKGADRALDVKMTGLAGSLSLKFGESHQVPLYDWIRYYAYVSSERWHYESSYYRGDEAVFVPHGDNLLYVARHNSAAYEFLKNTVSSLDWKLRFDQAQRTFRLSEIRQDEILDYNLDLLSDSLKRFFFYGTILLTSKNAALVMDEPDVFAFPPYPKLLGEMIATDESNQFFLTTHNPYFLAGIVGKTPIDDLGLFVCYRDHEGDTALARLSADQLSEVVEQGASVFFNLDAFVPA